jgi:hypothetical protein
MSLVDGAVAVSELAVLAPQVEASIAPDAADAASFRPTVEAALRTAAVAMREAAERVQSDADEAAQVLRELAGQLEQPQAWLAVDRLIHQLLGDVLRDAIVRPDGNRSAVETARATALGILARDAVLWPGAGSRMGCTYDYDGLLATARLAALAGRPDA